MEAVWRVKKVKFLTGCRSTEKIYLCLRRKQPEIGEEIKAAYPFEDIKLEKGDFKKFLEKIDNDDLALALKVESMKSKNYFAKYQKGNELKKILLRTFSSIAVEEALKRDVPYPYVGWERAKVIEKRKQDAIISKIKLNEGILFRRKNYGFKQISGSKSTIVPKKRLWSSNGWLTRN